MQCALDSMGQEVLAWDAVRDARHTCPGCAQEVVLKAGPVVVEHFAHRPGAACPLSLGESERHRQMKKQMGLLLRGMGCELRCEVAVSAEHRADLLVNGRFAVECQESPIGIAEMRQRTLDYTCLRLPVLWVWDLSRLCPGSGAEHFRDLDETREYRVPAEIRDWHRESYGRVYVLDAGGELRACHLTPAAPRLTDGGPQGAWRDYTPRALRRLDLHACGTRIHGFAGAGGRLLIASFGEPVWWKAPEGRRPRAGYIAILRMGPFHRIECMPEPPARTPPGTELLRLIPTVDMIGARDRLRRRFAHRFVGGIEAYNLTPEEAEELLREG
ncbi:MAG: hypothetical protein GX785_05735 [Armatimonadetes bacterium]|jgi:hypothetical protein|nr:hypothetical protein [Armatimonadota bacterium]HOM81644.1 competence protein CoiA family protein [Armatimonadota bacterium]HPO71487.1 competence protein CoiA family protein [Armatimonadota bacterium]